LWVNISAKCFYRQPDRSCPRCHGTLVNDDDDDDDDDEDDDGGNGDDNNNNNNNKFLCIETLNEQLSCPQ
jgi:hypothetical protein